MSSSWSSLSSVDKQAFYSILDEYFESRPHLFQQQSSGTNGDNFSAISNLAGANPKMTASALKSAGVPPSLAKPSNVSAASSASKHLNGIGSKVGQLSGKFSNHFANSEQTQQQPQPPNASSKPANSFTNLNKLAATPPISNQNSFAPPPTRRVAPSTRASSYSQAPPPPAPPARSKPHQDEELVEAMYDYEGTSQEDLSFKEHQIIKVTEHISDDWWNGQINNGPIGMFPSSYVKPI
ncbi:uncharacterized protein PGTG_06398 [Puccinia graminis f. sp. tritici CRL 75-36-700-3]|uniref:SH3 domain-containing protein n=1 Tax=Puccinia graminis f. sp. tritici (strain CRL 75-36-700-3 / race SCCL) TaxID=418459 RepID=E3K868_PUCGT|nr:uncharacterized protein PGTG_06398 [Puccinia graminis f. sp. tritici CRL 75-36-700-3]EFP80442.1 hypothetical protein PGTG_06398 [Puccinia graminis f. sp. tritici CRL 75-36-700-3]